MITSLARNMDHDLNLFFDPRCYLGRAIFMACKEIRTGVTLHKIDFSPTAPESEEYKEFLQYNPRKQSPALYDSKSNVFFDSRSIGLFVVNQYESIARAEKLMGYETRFRSKHDELLWMSQDVEHLIAKRYMNIWGVLLRGEKPNFDLKPKVLQQFAILDQYLKEYQTGDVECKYMITCYFSLPEMFMAFLIDVMDMALTEMPDKNPLTEYPRVRKWLDSFREVESWKNTQKQCKSANKKLAKEYKLALKNPNYRLQPFKDELPKGKLKSEKRVE